MLKHRLIVGSILIALLLLLPVLDDRLEQVPLTGAWQDLFLGKSHLPGGLLLFGLGLLIAPLAAVELSAIFRAQGIQTRTWLTASAAIAGLALSYCIPTSTDIPSADTSGQSDDEGISSPEGTDQLQQLFGSGGGVDED